MSNEIFIANFTGGGRGRRRNHGTVISDNPSIISRHQLNARERPPAFGRRIFPLKHLPPRLINRKYTVLLVYDLEVDPR